MTTIWTDQYKDPISFILAEDGTFILAEDSSEIVQEQTGRDSSAWTTPVKH